VTAIRGSRFRREFLVFTGSIILLGAAVITALVVGRYRVEAGTLLDLVRMAFSGEAIPEYLETPLLVIRSVRMPRIIMAVIVGASLSVSGAVFQGIFRNPLVSPSILGVSAGASFGAALAIILWRTNTVSVEVSAFIWALAAVTVAYRIGRRGGSSVTTLVLAGVIVSALFTAALSFIKYTADPYEELPAIVFWIMGGFTGILWNDVFRVLPPAVAGITLLILFRWRLNALSLGDEEATAMGLNVHRERVIYIILATLIVATAISACGAIGWVGLVVPHMARLIMGPDHNQVIPFSAVLGGVFMLVMDTIVRVLPGGEMPIGIITSFLGAPFLTYLLLRKQGGDWQM
jgi:iron complex transport system permease protein